MLFVGEGHPWPRQGRSSPFQPSPAYVPDGACILATGVPLPAARRGSGTGSPRSPTADAYSERSRVESLCWLDLPEKNPRGPAPARPGPTIERGGTSAREPKPPTRAHVVIRPVPALDNLAKGRPGKAVQMPPNPLMLACQEHPAFNLYGVRPMTCPGRRSPSPPTTARPPMITEIFPGGAVCGAKYFGSMEVPPFAVEAGP